MTLYHVVISNELRAPSPDADRALCISITSNIAPEDAPPELVTQLHTMTETVPDMGDPRILYVSSTEDGSGVTVLKNELQHPLNMIYSGWNEATE
jgi:hypothetical protein